VPVPPPGDPTALTVVRRDNLAIGVTSHPNCSRAERGAPVERLGGHRSGGEIPVEDDRLDAAPVDVRQYRPERWQVSVYVREHGNGHAPMVFVDTRSIK
jgi:hypothetical protein